MNPQEHRQLQAELASLVRLLDELPAGRAIERIGLEARKQEVEEELAAQPAPAREPLQVRLTFRGRPVVERYGIFAEFGALAVSTFSEAVAALGASLSGPVGTRGPLPGSEEFRLLLTGTVPGSFGFQLEEAPGDHLHLFPDSSPLALAIEQAKAIMAATLGTDDELTDAVSDVAPRALDALRKFLETLDRHEAVCALESGGEVFRFRDLEQLRRSVARLATDNIHERDEPVTGSFLGVLPNRRTFEFRREGTDEVIVGKVGKEIDDAASINRVLDRRVTIDVHSRRAGEGRPRYVLRAFREVEPARAAEPGDGR